VVDVSFKGKCLGQSFSNCSTRTTSGTSSTVRKIKIKINPTVQFCKTMFILAFVGYMEKYWWRRLTEGNCLFCGVFNDAASSSNFIVPYDRMINE